MIGDWLSYSAGDFLPFSPSAYWALFALENRALWPLGLALSLAGAAAFAALVAGRALPGRWIAFGLALLWLHLGWSFVAGRYGALNWAGEGLAWAFYAEAALLAGLGLAGRFPIAPGNGPAAWTGLALLAAGLFLWPAFAVLDGRPWAQAELFGLAPDPTAAATLGLLVLAATERRRAAATVRAVPALWLALSALTLLAMDAWQGWAAAACAAAGLAAWGSPGRTPPGRRPPRRRPPRRRPS